MQRNAHGAVVWKGGASCDVGDAGGGTPHTPSGARFLEPCPGGFGKNWDVSHSTMRAGRL